MSDKERLLNFAKQHSLAVVSTVNPQGNSESAVVGFGETDEFELIFGTYNSSRKYHNLQSKSEVSVVVGWDEGKTLQYEGVARELSGEEAEAYSEIYFKKSPEARQYKDHPEERYFLVSPMWARYTDLSLEPWEIIEVKF